MQEKEAGLQQKQEAAASFFDSVCASMDAALWTTYFVLIHKMAKDLKACRLFLATTD